MAEIQLPIEEWNVTCDTNASHNNPLIINDLPNRVRFTFLGQIINVLDRNLYPDNTANHIANSRVLSGYVAHQKVIMGVYLHTHSDIKTGKKGTSGSSGTSGTSGVTGIDGSSGISGSSGSSGTSGGSGSSGSSGIPGSSGSSGTSGTSGGSGSSGSSGIPGSSGSSGTSGTALDAELIEHNILAGLQGGNPSAEVWHLTLDEYSSLGTIGEAEDGTYTDGLFTDFDEDTPVGTAVDRFNEVLSSLAPPPAPVLDDVDVDTGGTTADLSFDEFNPIGEASYQAVDNASVAPEVLIDNAFTNSGDRVGVINASTDINGTLNEDVPIDTGTPNESYPANAFGDANLGILVLELNGVEQTSQNIDLTNASAQDTTSSDTTTGMDVIAATSVSFPGGDSFDQFKYRTGTYHVESGDMRLGWNYVRIIHRTTSDTITNYVDWVVDGNVVDTVYSSPVLDNLIMTGSDYLSGVRYHTDGTADYDIDIDHAFRNTYIIGNVITFSCTNGSISSQSLGNSSGDELLQVVVTDASFNVSSGRKLDATIIATTRVNRVFNSNENNDPGGSDNIPGLLMDDQIAGASGESDLAESFNAEGYRQESEAGTFSLTDTASYASGTGNGPAFWTNTESLVGANAGHNDGLLEYNGSLRYPTEGVNSGDFRNTGDGGPGCEEGYASNVNYSAASGDRVYLRYFYVGTGKQNFTFTIAGGGSSFVSVVTGVSSNNLTLELLVPNTTQNGGATIEFKDCFSTYTDINGIGCYSSGTRDDNTSNWVCTSGSRSTATGGNVIVIRITASSSWTGNISSISVAV